MNRRDFIEYTIKWGSVTTMGISLWEWLKPDVIESIQEIKFGINIPEKTKNVAKTLFHLSPSHISVIPANSNPNVRDRLDILGKDRRISKYEDLYNYYSSATIEASNVFRPFVLPDDSSSVFDYIADYKAVDTILIADPSSTIVALGTPTSNKLMREKMFYEELPNPNDGHVYDIRMSDMIHMPIHFELKYDNIINCEDRNNIWYRTRGMDGKYTDKKIANWGLVGDDGKPLLPATQDGKLLEDFLVISVIPNFTTPDNVVREVPLVCIGGTHAAGTMAIKKLFESENCLPDLLSSLNGLGSPKFWQAVFKVDLNPLTDAIGPLHLYKVKAVGVDQKKLLDFSERNA